ncbi:3'(2'),5'-bisphosphate nucleotidase CysQ [Candidatus Tachikawaea gelatinosa]|uniref:3'(2'),5'-bisphosphate nucleotidase CysQ n=1 Tax=Candidatus Tachikawaea gelatinosa TaxID=1410383 RepID=A0A090AL43_9ENTR|nr:3'(2'),5'-bisphosphate nucleotidase CysQ [Candidatus Tachikawaea gelatinosa]BAP58304.1 protein CysQ probable regulator [Candidatus Tachikawaea gelatinosa]
MLKKICKLVYKAGKNIMTIYKQKNIEVFKKDDSSPVTIADLLSNKIIIKGLQKMTPYIPILSEENLEKWEKRKKWTKYWLIDPLDGTKEFIHHNNEFTINIALIEHGKPILGVIFAPALSTIYYATKKESWKEKNGKKKQIFSKKKNNPLIIISRYHQDFELKNYLKNFNHDQITSVGSSLKFCLIAEGKAQIYPRFSPSNIWDTAAGHIIAISAGAKINSLNCSQDIDYFPRQTFINPGFIVHV